MNYIWIWNGELHCREDGDNAMAADREDCIDGVVPEDLSHRPTVSHHSQRNTNSLIRLYFNLVRFAKLGNAAVIKRQGKSARISK